ncbi:MAG: hypothetical protein WDM91_06095 [Rhizomicrobium sp.]
MVSLLVLLGGCAESDWSYGPPGGGALRRDDASPAGPSAAVVNYRTEMVSEQSNRDRCTRVAAERAIDADRQGFDETVHAQVYDKTYADCMEWSARRAR